MLNTYNLIVDIAATEKNLSEEQFRGQVEPCLSCLVALKGSFDKAPCRIEYYPPIEQPENSEQEYWSVRAIVLISVGKARGYNLMELYKSLVRLIELELPHFEVEAEVGTFEFA